MKLKSNTGISGNDPDNEKRLLISRATELSARSENSAVASSFLTPSEQRTVYESVRRNNLFFWGGFVGAERRIAIFLPSWIESEDAPPDKLFSEEREEWFLSLLSSFGQEDILGEFISVIKTEGSGYNTLSHRDFLGAAMALGIKRNVLGDIITDGKDGFMVVDNTCRDFILSELSSVGRDTVKCTPTELDCAYRFERSFTEIHSTVASMRADGVIRALTNVSREDAASLITKGLVEVNFYPLLQTDKRISEGDIISVRGHGKFIIDRAGDMTRRSRIRLEARKYI